MIKEQEPRQKTAKKVFPETLPSLPTLRINKNEETVSVDGRIIEFRKYSIMWRVFLFLASKPNADIDGSEIKSVERQCGSRIRVGQMPAIRNLRKLVEDDCRNPLIIVTTYFGGNCGKYRLNAKIEFTEESFLPKKSEKEKRIYLVDLTEGQEKIMYALFSINPQRTGFKNSRIKDVMMDIYGSELSVVDPEEREREIQRYYIPLIRKRIVSMGKIRGDWDKPPEQRLPKISKFREWLKEQPEYASITLEELELVARRRISFEELGKKANPAPAPREIPSQSLPPQAIKETIAVIPILTPEEIFVLVFNLLQIKQRRIGLLINAGVKLPRDDEIERLCRSLWATIERKIKKDKRLNRGRVSLDKQALITSLRKKLDIFKKDPSAFLQANKPEAQILLKYFVNLEKERLAVLLSALCP